jgi:hypothetical protein
VKQHHANEAVEKFCRPFDQREIHDASSSSAKAPVECDVTPSRSAGLEDAMDAYTHSTR